MSTRDMDMKADRLHRSNAIIEQRMAVQERRRAKETARQDSAEPKPSRKPLGVRPTAASRGHTKYMEQQVPRETFKMERFAQIEHGKIDTGNRRKETIDVDVDRQMVRFAGYCVLRNGCYCASTLLCRADCTTALRIVCFISHFVIVARVVSVNETVRMNRNRSDFVTILP
jgi:hypothetical protein